MKAKCSVLVCVLVAIFATAQERPRLLELKPRGVYQANVFDESAAEIVGYSKDLGYLYVVNAQKPSIDILDINDVDEPALVREIDLTPHGGAANSVSVHDGVIAAAIEAAVKQENGKVVFFDSTGEVLSAVDVGALPDMLTFSPDGNWVLVANEGEPDDDYAVDPEGSVSVIDVSGGAANVTQSNVRTAGFTAFNDVELEPSVRVFGPGATAAQDFEPEYITVSDDSTTAWVVLQENNALAIVDVASATVSSVVGLGLKDHSVEGNGLDASNRDDAINITTWPVLGMYMPDAIDSYTVDGETLLVLANEGDSRDYDGYSEEERVKDLDLDPTAFPNADALQENEALGRLKITTANGDTDGDGDFDQLYSYGARSFSIRNSAGELLYDSGDEFEQILAELIPLEFNSTNDENDSFDNRSDDKGPEPEGVVVAKIRGHHYAFIGLERVGGIMVYDITDINDVFFVQYITTRDFGGDAEAGTAGDLGPEGLLFIDWDESPMARPLLVVGHEVSGSTRIFEIRRFYACWQRD